MSKPDHTDVPESKCKCSDCTEPERSTPYPLVLFCPECGKQHIDDGVWATTRKHKTHLCAKCGFEWRPALVFTVGVKELK